MSETTLVGNTLNRDAWLLGHEITPNIERALSLEEITHYRQKKGEIVPALQRGFVLPGAIPLQAVSVELTRYPIEETDCFEWLGHMEQFADQYFGSKVNLRKMFTLPTRLPWKEVLPVFDPAGLTNRQMVDKALKAQGLQVYEGTDVQALTGATAEVSKLYLIERTAKPVPATMGLPPKYARHWFGGRQTLPLHLRGYGIGTGLLYKLEKKFLDHDATTASWFPENTFPADDHVAFGYYYPGRRMVYFSRGVAADEGANFGFREAIVLSPKPQS